jgi:hypothetical protein
MGRKTYSRHPHNGCGFPSGTAQDAAQNGDRRRSAGRIPARRYGLLKGPAETMPAEITFAASAVRERTFSLRIAR